MVSIPTSRSGSQFIIIPEEIPNKSVNDSLSSSSGSGQRMPQEELGSAESEIDARKMYSANDLQKMGLDSKIATYLTQTSATGGNARQQAVSGEKLLALGKSGTLQISKDSNNRDSISVNIKPNDGYTVLEIIATSNLSSKEATTLVAESGNGKIIGQNAYIQAIDDDGNLTPTGKVITGDSALGKSKGGYSEAQLTQTGLGSKEAKWLISQHGTGQSISARVLAPLIETDAQGNMTLSADALSAFANTQEISSGSATGNSVNEASLLRSGLKSDEIDFLLESYSSKEAAGTLTKEKLDSLISAGVLTVIDSESTPPKLKLNNETSLTPEAAKAAAVSVTPEGHDLATPVLDIKPDGTGNFYSTALTQDQQHPLAPTATEAQWLNNTYGGGDGLTQDELAGALEAGVVQVIDGKVMMTTKGKQNVFEKEGPSSANSLEHQKSMLTKAMNTFDPNGSGSNRKMTLLQLQAENNGLTIAAAKFLMDKYGTDGQTISQEQLMKAIEAGDLLLSSAAANPNDPSKGETYKLTITDPAFQEPVVELPDNNAKEEKRDKEAPETNITRDSAAYQALANISGFGESHHGDNRIANFEDLRNLNEGDTIQGLTSEQVKFLATVFNDLLPETNWLIGPLAFKGRVQVTPEVIQNILAAHREGYSPEQVRHSVVGNKDNNNTIDGKYDNNWKFDNWDWGDIRDKNNSDKQAIPDNPYDFPMNEARYN